MAAGLTARELGAEKSRSYDVRNQLTGGDHHDWSWQGTKTVFVRARRATPNVAAGERIWLISTSNAGFAGITAMGWRDGQFVHLGSLGNYDIVDETG